MAALPVTQAAPAKINLALHVTGRRGDGFHLLESLVVFAEVGDELEVVPADRDTLTVRGPFAPALGGSDNNLVSRAVAAFRSRWPQAIPGGLALTLSKNLPVAAGLGGGSADAAAALRLLARLAEDDVGPAALLEVAAGLGADVPMCLYSRAVEVRGIGEIIAPLRSFPSCHVVLVNPMLPVATADVFRRLTRRDNPGLPPRPDPLARPAQLALWLADTRNDLEPAARELVPVIGTLADEMTELEGCMLGRMSGSGATVFGLFASAAQAHQAAHDLRARWPAFWVAASPLLKA